MVSPSVSLSSLEVAAAGGSYSPSNEKDERRPSTASGAGGEGGEASVAKKRRHSVLMDTSVKNFQRLVNNAGEHMRIEVENLPLRALT